MNTNEPSLGLHEEILLLALRDREGTIASGTMYQYAIGGAMLAELLLRERIAVEQRRRSKLAVIRRRTRIGEPLLDESLTRIADAKRRASLQTWVARFGNTRDLRHRIARGLCQRGVLRADEDKVLLIFSRKIYPEVDPKPERALLKRLELAIFREGKSIDARTVVLTALANSAGILKLVFDKKRLRERKARLDKITSGDLTAAATKEAIEAVQAAVMMAAIMPALISAATVSH